MSGFDAAAARARADAATDGPWWADSWEIYGGTYDSPRYDERGDQVWIAETCDTLAPDGGEANGQFIAHARTDLPAALDMIAEQAATIARVRESAHAWQSVAGGASDNDAELIADFCSDLLADLGSSS